MRFLYCVFYSKLVVKIGAYIKYKTLAYYENLLYQLAYHIDARNLFGTKVFSIPR